MAEELETTRAEQALAEAEASVLDNVRDDLEGETLTIPMLALVQGTTKDPPDDAHPGDFVNTLTGEVAGSEVEFIISRFHRGRFLVWDEDKQAPATQDTTNRKSYATADAVAPSYWPAQYAGRAFVEIEDAEETFKRLANDPDNNVDWGSGPPINTTYNFTGYVRGSDVPVRLSLKRGDTRVAQKIVTLMKAQRAPWDKALVVSSFRNVKGDKVWQAVKASFGSVTDTEEKLRAVQLAQQLEQVAVREAGVDALDADPAAEREEKPEGALDVN